MGGVIHKNQINKREKHEVKIKLNYLLIIFWNKWKILSLLL